MHIQQNGREEKKNIFPHFNSDLRLDLYFQKESIKQAKGRVRPGSVHKFLTFLCPDKFLLLLVSFFKGFTKF